MVKTTITVAQGDMDLLRAAGRSFEGIKLSQVVRAALRVGIPALARNPGLLWIPVQPPELAQRVEAPDVDMTPPSPIAMDEDADPDASMSPEEIRALSSRPQTREQKRELDRLERTGKKPPKPKR